MVQYMLNESENKEFEKIEFIDMHQKICAAIISGHVDEAMSQLDLFVPGALKKYPSLLFRLRVQKLIEMVLD